MTADRWKLIARVFEAAVEVGPAEREELLRRECGDDAELRGHVERLLRNDGRAGNDFLVPATRASYRPGGDSDDVSSDASDGRGACDGRDLRDGRDAPDPLIGRTIASYTIGSVIARGGMGTVYLAEQERPRREVALKVMTAGLWSRSAQRQFEFETEVLGRLHHPNIAQVYESGVAPPLPAGEGRGEGLPPVPFFAMEHIPGARTITAYCHERGLGLRERLDLFGTLCDAVHYGHQKGVVHP